MKDMYGAGSRGLQDRFDTRRIADRIESLDMFFLATVDARGHASCSYKGGAPGFVRVLDERTIAFPSFDGNGMFLSMGNVIETQEVGLLFIDFLNQTRMRLNGTASIDPNDALLAQCPEAQLIVRIAVREVFPNCPRYIHKLALVERSRFVPKDCAMTPVPSWKRAEWAADALPAVDPARDASREVLKK